MNIEKVENDKEKYMELLLEADPEENAIRQYINNSDMYIGRVNNEIVCEIVIAKVNDEECEVKNIATSVECSKKLFYR